MNYKQLLQSSVVRFAIVGVVNTVMGTALMFGLYNLAHVGYYVASATNYILTSILSYFLNKHFTFQNKEKGGRQILRFALNIAVCYVLAYGLAEPLVRWVLTDATVSLRENIAMLVGMVLFTGFNYLGQRFFAFATPKK